MLQTFTCTYDKTLYRDEYNGFTLFTVRPTSDNVEKDQIYGTVLCRGIVQLLPPNAPLEITADEITQEGKKPVYAVQEYKLAGIKKEEVSSFLTSKMFGGIGEKVGEKILKVVGDENIFDFATNPEAVDMLVDGGVQYKTASQLIQKLNEMTSIKTILEVLHPYGGTLETVTLIKDKFGAKALSVIQTNPYQLIEASIPFSLCDNYAKAEGEKGLSRERLVALLTESYINVISSGSTKATLPMLFSEARRVEFQANTGFSTSPFNLLHVLLESDFILTNEDGKTQVYKTDIYNQELDAARNIYRLSHSHKGKDISETDIVTAEKSLRIEYSKEQKNAFSLLNSPGVKILTGGPGTGKTTVINGMIQVYEMLYPDAVITLCAPTGCAAKRIQETTHKKASTIHKLLDIKPYNGRMTQAKDEYDQLTADLLIVDECSMLDTEIFSMLIRAIKTGAILLLVGDEDQLPSVGAGNILHDLLQINEIPRVRLKKVYRQKGDSLILENSIKIRQGKDALKTGSDYEIYLRESEKEMKEVLLDKIKEYYDPDSPNSTKIYSPTKQLKYQLSTASLNKLSHTLFNPDVPGYNNSLVYGNTSFSKGDPVIFTENDYKLGFYNGETGVVKQIISDESGREMVVDKEGRDITISGPAFNKVDLAYAITTHKSQGSECDTAIILLPETPKNMLERSLVYVATTRAKRKNILICQNNALKKAINTKKINERNTGLKNRVAEVFSA